MADPRADGRGEFLYGLSVHATLLCLLVKPLPIVALLGWLPSSRNRAESN